LSGLGQRNTTQPSGDGPRVALAVILACYLVVGTLYAWETPKWQTPDEPAHFNYVQYVAEENRLPVLQAGDYPHEYLEQIKAARFPQSMSIAPLRYESHQPPLYYVLAAIVYRAAAGLSFDLRFLLLRLFSVLLGAATLWVLYQVVREGLAAGELPAAGAQGRRNPAVASSELLALGATALAATVPMYVAMTAAINNDALAGLLLALLLWLALRVMQRGLERGSALATGVLLGLVVLTKTTIYLVAGGVILLSVALSRPAWRAKVRYLAVVLGVALLLALPFLARNAWLYGGLDVLGWGRHDSIVSGQLRTSELIAQIGALPFVQRLAVTTFRSFWAQFGWMGVLVDERIYYALAVLTAGALGGLAVLLWRLARREIELTARQSRVLLLMGAVIVLTLLTYLGYNLKFVQHQGRYLFPALMPLALAAALGLQELLAARIARRLVVALAVMGGAPLMLSAVSGDAVLWPAVLLAGATGYLIAAGWLPARRRWALPATLYAALLSLDLMCLFGYILPALG